MSTSPQEMVWYRIDVKKPVSKRKLTPRHPHRQKMGARTSAIKKHHPNILKGELSTTRE
jgi:hypothetical protein